MRKTERRIEITEQPAVPVDAVLLGYGAMLPFPGALVVVWLGAEAAPLLALAGLRIWGAAILIFLAGVRRGLSFRTPGGPRPAQLAMALWLFGAGLAVLVLPPVAGLAVQLAGYGSLLVLDPIAARRSEAPLYFARLRPAQMAIPVASLALLILSL